MGDIVGRSQDEKVASSLALINALPGLIEMIKRPVARGGRRAKVNMALVSAT